MPILRRPLHGLHAALLAGTVPLFLGVLLSDIAYTRTWEIQWKNFSSWLLVGALIFGACALVWAIVDAWRCRRQPWPHFLYVIALLVMWVLGFINALLHSADAAASMSAALVLSWIIAVLAIAATWLGFSSRPREVVP